MISILMTHFSGTILPKKAGMCAHHRIGILDGIQRTNEARAINKKMEHC